MTARSFEEWMSEARANSEFALYTMDDDLRKAWTASRAALLADRPDVAGLLDVAGAVLDPKVECPVSHPRLIADLADALESLAAQLAEARKENDTLRGLLGNSAKPCPYCGLAAEDQAKCPSGFPGCARADDQMLSQHFADAYHAEKAEAELAKVKAHAEAMATTLDDWSRIDQCPCVALDNYRAEFKGE